MQDYEKISSPIFTLVMYSNPTTNIPMMEFHLFSGYFYGISGPWVHLCQNQWENCEWLPQSVPSFGRFFRKSELLADLLLLFDFKFLQIDLEDACLMLVHCVRPISSWSIEVTMV